MGKSAWLFPGQGSQYAGMGKSLADKYSQARATFEEADDALGLHLSRLCFEGPEEELKLTENTQPAILAVSVAMNRVLQSHPGEMNGSPPVYLAGHSLGEYSALVAAGSLGFSDALRLVRNRGRYMQSAVPAGMGAMAALLKMPEGAVESVLQAAAEGEVVTVANYNSPDQVVIAGHAGAVDRAMGLARQAGARHAVLLHVSAPFHCPLMKPAQEMMAADLASVTFSDPKTPVINNWQAREVTDAGTAREGLYHQIPNPVLWTQTIRYLASRGVTEFCEVGPRKVLTGLIRSIDPSLKASAADGAL
jgi:[acyl-carrier-protein] S-malonyltransferase